MCHVHYKFEFFLPESGYSVLDISHLPLSGLILRIRVLKLDYAHQYSFELF